MPIFRQKRQKFATQSLPKHNKTGEIAVNFSRFAGAADRSRTGTPFTAQDFKSCASAYSATAAYIL